MTTDQKFLSFLEDWLEWAEGRRGFFKWIFGTKYSKICGLCSSMSKFAVTKHQNSYNDLKDKLRSELVDDFGLYDSVYPFGGSGVFDMDMENSTQHLNESRREWVREKIKKYKGVQSA